MRDDFINTFAVQLHNSFEEAMEKLQGQKARTWCEIRRDLREVIQAQAQATRLLERFEISPKGAAPDLPDETLYRCASRRLAGGRDYHFGSNSDPYFPEKLLKGTVIEVVPGGQYENPAYDPEDIHGDEPEMLTWYVDVDSEGVYSGILSTSLAGTDSVSTIQVSDSDGVLSTFSVHAYYLGSVQTIEEETGVMVARQSTEGGKRLVVVKSRSVLTQVTP